MSETNYQHTRVIVRIDSHVNGMLDISDDCIYLNTSKTTKQKGRFQLHLVPRRSYLNLVHPNDVVNIYIDPGDGKRGFIRTMFGYVDRIERMENVGENGEMNTKVVIIGSDFQKAIEETCIYFNQYLFGKVQELYQNESGTSMTPVANELSAGATLRTAGITASGTPAGFVESFLQILLGFGQQWTLPTSYAKDNKALESNRKDRVQRAKDKIPNNVKDLIAKLGFNPEAIENSIKEINDIVSRATTNPSDLLITKDLSPEASAVVNLVTKEVTSIANDSFGAGLTLETFESASRLLSSSQLLAFENAISTTDPGFPKGILDTLTFDFIESLCIDGYQADETVWQVGSDTLARYLYSHINELVNELIFDLRPVSADNRGLSEGGYSTDPDELGINTVGVNSFAASVAAVKYVPAVVFREYPYSVVEGINLDNILALPLPTDSPPEDAGLTADEIAIRQAVRSQTSDKVTGFVPFGPVFSQSPNVPGRHVYVYDKPIAPDACSFSSTSKPIKHIDVITIRNTDVKESAIGRSDEQLFNLFSLQSKNFGDINENYRYSLGNFSPILSPVSISRHGLRTRELVSEFANFIFDDSCTPTSGSLENAGIRKLLVRWQLLIDHWFQHNIEYLSGTITLRGMPELRVGYRLDWVDRNESYYVDSVSHAWAYPGALQTSIEVSQGQRNDPFPAYIPPIILDNKTTINKTASGDRGQTSRLGEFFPVKDTKATLGSVDRSGKLSTGDNYLDKSPEANRHGKAYYSNQTFAEINKLLIDADANGADEKVVLQQLKDILKGSVT